MNANARAMAGSIEARGFAAEPHGAEAAAVLVLGVGLLLLRLGVHGRFALAELAVIYLAVFVLASRAQVIPERSAPMWWVPVLLIGIGAVAAASLGAGRPLPSVVTVGGVALNSAAAIGEEAFFRRFLYGRLTEFGVPAAIGGSAVLFALIHLPAYGPAAFWLDLSAGLVLSWQRWASGSWRVPAATHVVANLAAVLR